MASSSMNQEPPRYKNFESEEDMISSLPNEVLVHVLSFLSTKDAFRTSILSSRWEKLWTVVPNLHFCPNQSIGSWESKNEDPRYMDFIERIFQSHDSCINKFYISYNPRTDISRLNAWVCSVLEHNVQHIEIKHFNIHMQLPDSLFTCKTLVTLKIGFCLKLDVPDSIYFPCLKVFYIEVECPSNELTEKLFCSSPVLEDLRIHVLRDSGEVIYNISSPALKKLYLCICTSDIRNFDSVVNIDALVLESLEVVNDSCAHYIFKNSPALVKARISVDIHCYHDEAMEKYFLVGNLVTLLNSISYVKDLSLGGHLPMAVFSFSFGIKWPVFGNVTYLELQILDDYESASFSKWPVFPNLVHLQLNVDKDYASKNLSDLLELAPKLASLVFVRGYYRENPEKFNCAEQRSPSCLQSCLREIEVRNFDGLESELNLMKYLLANAQVLETMRVTVPYYIYIYEQQKVGEWKSEIDMMPRCSKGFELKLS